MILSGMPAACNNYTLGGVLRKVARGLVISDCRDAVPQLKNMAAPDNDRTAGPASTQCVDMEMGLFATYMKHMANLNTQ